MEQVNGKSNGAAGPGGFVKIELKEPKTSDSLWGNKKQLTPEEFQSLMAAYTAVVELANQRGEEIKRLNGEVTQLTADLQAERNKEPMVEYRDKMVPTPREHTPDELLALVNNHSITKTLREKVDELLALLEKRSVVYGLDRANMVSWPVNPKDGQPLKCHNDSKADFFIFTTDTIAGPASMFGVLPTQVGEFLEIHQQAQHAGKVEFRIKCVEEDGVKIIRVETLARGKFLPDVVYYDYAEYEAGLMRPEGFRHTPRRGEYRDWAGFSLNYMLNSAGRRATGIEAVICSFQTLSKWREFMARQAANHVVDAAPDLGRQLLRGSNGS